MIHGLVVIEGMNLSGHPWIINEIYICNLSNHHFETILDIRLMNGEL